MVELSLELAVHDGMLPMTKIIRSQLNEILKIWRRERDSNPRYALTYTHFPGVRLQPLGHLSVDPCVLEREGFCQREKASKHLLNYKTNREP